MIEEKNDLMKNIANDSSNNMRKYLILGGGAFILFVVGIVAAKFIFSSPKKENTSVILPPDITKNEPAKKNPVLFNDIPIENDNNQANNTNATFEKPKIKQQSQTQPQQTATNNTDTTLVEKKPEVQKVQVPKEEIKTPKKTQPVIKKQTVKTNIAKNYYLQVAAVTRGNPAPKFLKLITKNGFKYKIVTVNIKGMKVKRVLVGPFTYKEVKKVLPKVRQKISSSAFIKRLK